MATSDSNSNANATASTVESTAAPRTIDVMGDGRVLEVTLPLDVQFDRAAIYAETQEGYEVFRWEAAEWHDHPHLVPTIVQMTLQALTDPEPLVRRKATHIVTNAEPTDA